MVWAEKNNSPPSREQGQGQGKALGKVQLSPSVVNRSFFCGTGFPTKKDEEPRKGELALFWLLETEGLR